MKIKNLIESKINPEEIVATMNGVNFLTFSLNALAIDLVSGDQGDVVIDGDDVWVFTDSEEHARRILQYIAYDPRYAYNSTHMEIVAKYPNQSPDVQEDSSYKIKLEDKLSPSDQKLYMEYNEDKYFYYRDEYSNWF